MNLNLKFSLQISNIHGECIDPFRMKDRSLGYGLSSGFQSRLTSPSWPSPSRSDEGSAQISFSLATKKNKNKTTVTTVTAATAASTASVSQNQLRLMTHVGYNASWMCAYLTICIRRGAT